MGTCLALANGWAVKTSRLNGLPRLEVLVPAYQSLSVGAGMMARGLITETVSYQLRYFIPAGESEPIVFHKLLEESPLAA